MAWRQHRTFALGTQRTRPRFATVATCPAAPSDGSCNQVGGTAVSYATWKVSSPPARPSPNLLVCLLPVQKTPQSLISGVTACRANFRSCLANRSFSSCVLHRTMLCGAPRPTPQRQDSIFDLAIQKHKPGCGAASALARLAGDSSREHGCPELLHQFIWNAFQDFACLRITVFPSRFEKALLLSHVLRSKALFHRVAPGLNLLAREPGVQVVGVVSLTPYTIMPPADQAVLELSVDQAPVYMNTPAWN